MTFIEIGHYFAVAMDGLILMFGSIVIVGVSMSYLPMNQTEINS